MRVSDPDGNCDTGNVYVSVERIAPELIIEVTDPQVSEAWQDEGEVTIRRSRVTAEALTAYYEILGSGTGIARQWRGLISAAAPLAHHPTSRFCCIRYLIFAVQVRKL